MYTKYEIGELPDGDWFFRAGEEETYLGSLKEVAKFAHLDFGLQLDEISTGVSEMIDKNHNTIHFGMNGFMIYTYNLEHNTPTIQDSK